MPDARPAWTRRILFFLAGVGIFLLVREAWGEAGVRGGRMIAIAVLTVGFLVVAALMVAGRRRTSTPSSSASDIARLLKKGLTDEAVRTGRDLYGKTPDDPHVAWYYTAALMKSGHTAEARRVLANLRRESLPPKMAAMYDEVKTALESR